MPLFDLPLYLDLAVLPIGDQWPRPRTPLDKQKRSAFSAAATSTYRDLQRELDAVDATDRVLRVPVAELAFRRDGRPRADARLEGSALLLEFVDRRGDLQRYPSDAYLHWQENLRAIALTLQALRAVDRYGVTASGEQYRGFLALTTGLESGPGDVVPDRGTASSARSELLRIAGPLAQPSDTTEQIVRAAQRATHPDLGRPRSEWDYVQRLVEQLRRAGGLP